MAGENEADATREIRGIDRRVAAVIDEEDRDLSGLLAERTEDAREPSGFVVRGHEIATAIALWSIG